MTAAGVGLALTSSETFEGEHKEIREKAMKLNKELPRAIDDFIAFLNKSEVKDEIVPNTIGLWVLWNVKKKELNDEEIKQLTGTVGNLLLKVVSDWKASQNKT